MKRDERWPVRSAKNTARIAGVVMAAGWLVAVSDTTQVYGESSNVKTEKGIHFAVPEDWPIEERNGALAPVSVEEYVMRKFKEMESRLKDIEQKLRQGESVEESAEPAMKSNASGSSANVPDAAASTQEIKAEDIAHLEQRLESLENVEARLNTLESRLSAGAGAGVEGGAAGTQSLETRMEYIERQLRNLEFRLDI